MELNVTPYAPPPTPDYASMDNEFTHALIRDLFCLKREYVGEAVIPVIYRDESRVEHCGRNMSLTKIESLYAFLEPMARWAEGYGLRVRGRLAQGWVFGLLVDNPFPDPPAGTPLAQDFARRGEQLRASVQKNIESRIKCIRHKPVSHQPVDVIPVPFRQILLEAMAAVAEKGYRPTTHYCNDNSPVDRGYALCVYLPEE